MACFWDQMEPVKVLKNGVGEKMRYTYVVEK